jgi:hypothetical protein
MNTKKSTTKVATMSTSLISTMLFLLALSMLSHTVAENNFQPSAPTHVSWLNK